MGQVHVIRFHTTKLKAPGFSQITFSSLSFWIDLCQGLLFVDSCRLGKVPHLFEAKYRTGPPCYNKILGKQAVWKLPGDVGLMKEILVKFNYVKLWHEEAGSTQQAGSSTGAFSDSRQAGHVTNHAISHLLPF